jgi:hypothetical protein
MSKYGKLLLSAYIMKKMKSEGSPRSRGKMHKYAKLALGAYLLNKLKSGKTQKEVKVEPEEEIILSKAGKVETGGGSSMKIGKIILGALAGATLIYTVKKHAAKRKGHKIEVE